MDKIIISIVAVSSLAVVSGCDAIDRMDKQSRAYCFEQERYLSNEELKNIAIAYLIDQLNEHPPEWYDATDPNVIVYESVEHFKELNPSFQRDPFRRDKLQDGKKPERVEQTFYEAGGVNKYVFHSGLRLSFSVLKEAQDSRVARSLYFVTTACGEIYGAKFNSGGLFGGARVDQEARQKYFGFEEDK